MYQPLNEQLKHAAWAGLEWIWLPPAAEGAPAQGEGQATGNVYFRQTLSLDQEPVRAWIQVWSDTGYGLWVNGHSAYESPQGLGWSHQDDIEHLLHAGDNTIAIEFYVGRSRYWWSGLLLAGEVELADGRVIPLRSDTTWLSRPDPAAGWQSPAAPAAGWQPAMRTAKVFYPERAPDAPILPVAPGSSPAPGRPRIDFASFDPNVLRRQVASFYGIEDADQLRIPGERYVAFQAGGYWAPLEKLPDGSIAAVVRAGGCHSGRDGRLLWIRSYDGGKHWAAPVVVADSAWNDYGCALGALADGTLIVGYRKYRNYDGRGNYVERDDTSYPIYGETMVIRSEDDGRTWDKPEVTSPRGEPCNLPYGKMVEFLDGTVWMAEYHGVPYYRASHDKGKSWGPLQTITTQDCNETALLRLREGPVIAAIRGGDEGGQACWVTRTEDRGATWSPPLQVTEPGEHPPDLIQLQSGRLLLTFGRRVFPFGVQVMFSDDLGKSWYRPQRHILTWDAFHDHGYPSSVQMEDGTIVTIYYATGNRLHPEIGVHTGVIRWREDVSK